MNLPDPITPDVWASVPARARFVAMDQSGEWFWYADVPLANRANTGFKACGSFGCIHPNPEPVADWAASLIKRPEA